MVKNAPMPAKILVINNYDSFVFNLVQYLSQLGAECTVVRNDEIEADAASGFDGVLISPGPGVPENAGVSIAIIKFCAAQGIPVLGVCLGHQGIGVAFGATVSRAPELLHGKTSLVFHKGHGILSGLPSPFTATRYHSLCIEPETINSDFEITSQSDSGIVMSIRHKALAIEGVQFHPESVLTEHGHAMLANWLNVCGDAEAQGKAIGLSAVVGSKN